MFAWNKKPKPNYDSRGEAYIPPVSTAPPLPIYKAPVGDGKPFDYNAPPPAPLTRPPAPAPTWRPPQGTPLTVQRTRAIDPQPPNSSGYSPAMETFASLGEPYFVETGNAGQIAQDWSLYPAIQDVSMAGFALQGAGDITGASLGVSGEIAGASVVSAGAITGASLGVSGAITAVGNITSDDAVFAASLNGLSVTAPQVNTTYVQVNQQAPGFPGIIQLADNTNTLGILKTLDQDLYWNDELLAKAGDIQNVADWSLFPALQNVDMAEKGLTNASAVGITDGVFPQFLTPSEKGLNINGSVVGVSADTTTETLWGTANTAIGDAEAANITAGEALAAAEAAQGTADTAEAAAIAAGVAAAGAAATAATALAQSGVTQVNSQTGGIILQSTGSTVAITNPSSGRINFEVAPAPVGVSSLNTLTGAVDISGGTNISVTPSGQSLVIANTMPTPVTSLNTLTGGLILAAGTDISVTPAGSTLTIANTRPGQSAAGTVGAVQYTNGSGLFQADNTFFYTAGTTTLQAANMKSTTNETFGGTLTDNVASVGTANQVLTAGTGGQVKWAAPSVAFNYNIYVSNVSGNDTTGNGQIVNPYKTIGRAVTFANTIADSIPIIINLAAGTYTEDVNISRNLTYLAGGSTTLSSSTVVNGTILYDLTGTSQVVVVGGVSSIQLSRFQVTNNVAKNQSLVLTDCIIAPLSALNCVLATDTSVGGNCDVTIQNSVLYAFSSPAVDNTSVALNFVNTQITTTPGVTYNGTLMQTSGTGRFSLFGCDVLQPSVASTVAPLIVLGNTIATPNTMVFNSTILQYPSATSDAGTLGKACIRFTNPAGITMGISTALPAVSMFNCFLQCQGATTTNGSAGQFVCIQKATGGGTAYFNWLNCACGATANHISQFLTRTSWVALTT